MYKLHSDEETSAMCGISVVFNKKPGSFIDKNDLERMTDIISHRGPDDFGYFIDAYTGLGHRRLSVIDLSKAASQPFCQDEYILVFNGEIFNYLELKALLYSEGVHFSTESDTEVLLKSYIFWGEDCIKRFNGMWSFVIYNTSDHSLFFSRDRYGIKPLYLYEDESAWYFSSEIKQFTVLPSWKKEINQDLLIDFLKNGKLNHTDDTLFAHVKSIPAGAKGTIQKAEFRTEKYYSVSSMVKGSSVSEDDFNKSWKKAVQLRLRSDVPLGVSLSGGLDSTCITAVASQNSSGISSFSVVYDEGNISERKYVDDASRMYKTHKNVLSPQYNDLINNLRDVIWYQDQPIASTSVIAQYLLYKEHKQKDIVVSLSGQGADEILGGYYPFYLPYFKDLIRAGKFIELILAVTKIGLPLLQKRLKHGRPDYFNIAYNPTDIQSQHDSILEKSVYYVEKTLPLLLHYEDRSSMAHSIESRQPFLDHHFVKTCLSLPDAQIIKNGISKYMLRESMKSDIPRSIYSRVDKLSYSTPQKRWFYENRADIVNIIKKSPLHKWLKTSFYKDYLSSSLDKVDDGLIIRILSTIVWLEIFELEL